MNASSDTNIDVKTYPIRLRNRGQITVPQSIRESLDLDEGDMLTLIQVNDLILMTPKQPQIPNLADKIASLMDEQGINLTDLLIGLDEERLSIETERQQDA
jgi:AbrB family looped-hinge helix DNA binding protein